VFAIGKTSFDGDVRFGQKNYWGNEQEVDLGFM